MALLETAGLCKSFGALRALDEPDVAVEDGEIVGLIGPNGAGKTTLFNVVTGIESPDTGTVRFDGRDVTGWTPERLAQAGLVRTFQQTRELRTMTVRENVRLGATDRPGERALGALVDSERSRRREAAVSERAEELLEFFDLSEHRDDFARALSGGQRKLLEIARALMLDPELCLLDEPLAGVNPTLERTIVDYVERLNDEGMTVLVIEHNVELLREFVDRLVVMHQGRVLAAGDADAVLRDEAVVDAYLGEAITGDVG